MPWRGLIGTLNEVDQIVQLSAADLPGRRLDDLLKILSILRDHSVGLYLHDERIDTGSSGFALLDLIEAYRRAKLSQAIRNGQAKALAAGKRIGRPIVPPRVQDRIRVALTNGGGVRPTARQFNVSPASVINIRRTMTVGQCTSC
jgi:DNA invertase Pin-like site-specific DNA recombinase